MVEGAFDKLEGATVIFILVALIFCIEVIHQRHGSDYTYDLTHKNGDDNIIVEPNLILNEYFDDLGCGISCRTERTFSLCATLSSHGPDPGNIPIDDPTFLLFLQ